MTSGSDFNAERDPMLGAVLRAHLDGADPGGFTRQVLARLGPGRRASHDSSWDVLANWARPGIAAALLLATMAGAVLAIREVRNSDDPSAVLAEAMERDHLVGVVLGSAR